MTERKLDLENCLVPFCDFEHDNQKFSIRICWERELIAVKVFHYDQHTNPQRYKLGNSDLDFTAHVDEKHNYDDKHGDGEYYKHLENKFEEETIKHWDNFVKENTSNK